MAATRTAETPSEGTGATGAAATAPLEATRETTAAPTQRASEDSAKPPGRRRLALLVGAIAAVAIAAAAIALGSGGGGGGGDSTAGAQGRQGKPQQRKPQKETLTAAQLNAKAGEICLNSQVEFTAARDQFPNGETDINEAKPFALRLTQVSEKALRGLRRLVPPPGAAEPYAAYVEARKRVHQYDIEAYGAAVRGDLAGFQAARQKNTDEGPDAARAGEEGRSDPPVQPDSQPAGLISAARARRSLRPSPGWRRRRAAARPSPPGELIAGERAQSASVPISVPSQPGQRPPVARLAATGCDGVGGGEGEPDRAAAAEQVRRLRGSAHRGRCTLRVASGAAIAAEPRIRSKTIMLRFV